MVDVIDRHEPDASAFWRVFHVFENRITVAYLTTEIMLFAIAWGFIALFDGELANVLFGMAFSLGALGAIFGVIVGVFAVLSRF